MSLPYFFVEDLNSSNTLVLPEETSKHCIQVLRMKEGERMQLTDGKGGLATVQIINADRKHCKVHIEENKFEGRSFKKVSVALSLLKSSSRFEWFLEKAT